MTRPIWSPDQCKSRNVIPCTAFGTIIMLMLMPVLHEHWLSFHTFFACTGMPTCTAIVADCSHDALALLALLALLLEVGKQRGGGASVSDTTGAAFRRVKVWTKLRGGCVHTEPSIDRFVSLTISF